MMTELRTVLGNIIFNAQRINYDTTKRVLVLYEEKILYIGDCCIRFDKLKYFKSFLKTATIDINFSIKDNFKFYNAFLTNNPHIDRTSTLSWEEIDFASYDIVFCAKYDEGAFLQFLRERYGDLISQDQCKLAVFSLSQLLLRPRNDATHVFPVNEDLLDYIKNDHGSRLGELYINEEEQTWANQWLESKGLRPNENLFIVCDSASSREKLLNIAAYFDVLKFLLRQGNSKVLIFDEEGIGKEEFYRQCLGKNSMRAIIFSKRLTLREDLRILASRHTKLIFGPCTGLLHCASSIYNNYVNRGMNIDKVPLMITYTGQYTKENKNANFWWGNSPLINCLLLKRRHDRKQIVLLNNLSEKEKNADDSLPCSEYTAEMLIEFINSKLQLKGREEWRSDSSAQKPACAHA